MDGHPVPRGPQLRVMLPPMNFTGKWWLRGGGGGGGGGGASGEGLRLSWNTHQILYCGWTPGSEPEGPSAGAQLGTGARAATP